MRDLLHRVVSKRDFRCRRLASRCGAAIIVHDEEDRFAPYGDSQRATMDGRTRLVSTRGLGHGRILASAPLFAAFDSLAGSHSPA